MSPDTLDLRLVARRLVDDACEQLAADAVALWLRGADGSELGLALAAGFARPETAADLDHRPAARLRDWLIDRRLPAVATLKPSDTVGERSWLAAEGIHSLLAVPVATADEVSVGVLAAFRHDRPFPVGYLARAVGVATTAAPTLYAAQRLAEQRGRAERAEMLLAVSQALAAGTDLDGSLDEVAARTARAVGASRCDIRLSASDRSVEQSDAALVVPIVRRKDAAGSLTLTGPPAAGWTPAAVELASAVAAQIGVAADGAHGHAEAERNLLELQTIHQTRVQGETLRALADLAGGAAHHLNNLLTIVVGRVQLVLRSCDDERVLRPLGVVEKAAKDGAEVVRRLQQFSRVRQIAEPRPVDLEDLLREVAAPFQGRRGVTPGSTIEVESRFGAVAPVAGDATTLREALSNIVLNAVDAMPDGGRLILTTDAAGDSVSASVTDTGVGMSDGVRFRAQQPFFTTKGVKATGLGLSVAYGIVRSHGGDMTIRSAEGTGTTVTVTLPKAAAAPSPGPVPPGALRILLVDDESDVREALADMLMSQGHTVLTASDGEEALAVVEREPGLDLVLTDLVMPGLTGWDVAAAAKERRPHVSVGVVTGWGEPLDRPNAPRHGVDFVVDKPVTLDVLRDVLARVRRR